MTRLYLCLLNMAEAFVVLDFFGSRPLGFLRVIAYASNKFEQVNVFQEAVSFTTIKPAEFKSPFDNILS